MGEIKKAMILSAGLGTRLLPITENLPKPLVPVLNIPNILYSIFLLKNVGIKDIVVNTHYLAKPLEEYLGNGNQWGVNIVISNEKDKLLGTAGGLKKAESLIGEGNFILCNSDFICNFDLNPVIHFHLTEQSLATMVLFENSNIAPFYAKVGINKKNCICLLPSSQTDTPIREGTFSGIHILHSEIFSYLQEEPSGINQVLYPQLMKYKPEKAKGYFLKEGHWFDTGELDTLWSTSMKLLSQLGGQMKEVKELLTFQGYQEKSPGIWCPLENKGLEKSDLIAPLLIGKGVTVGEGCRIGPNVVIGDQVNIPNHTAVEQTVILENSLLSQSQYRNRLVFNKTSLRTQHRT